MMKKIFIFFLTILLSYCLSVVLSSPAYAQDAPAENWVDGDYAGGITGALGSGEMNAPGYASHMQTNFMADFVRRTLGPVPGLTITEQAYKNNPRLVAQMRGGAAVNGISTYIAYMYMNPPANTVTFIADLGHSLGFMPKAYAQGIGFSGMSALLPVWKAFRNIAYLLLSIFLIVIGFMVMLRKKIDPKTVVTIQNALPKIVLTLLIITFSYAIVGILIDLMYLSIYLIVGIFESTKLLPPVKNSLIPALAEGYANNQQLYSQGGIFAVIGNIFRQSNETDPTNLSFKILGINNNFAQALSILGIVGGIALTATGNPIAGILLGVTSGLPVILALFISLAILLLVIRLFAFFLGCYIQIILALIFGPIQLIMEAFPGSTAFSSWIKHLISNIVVFPVGAAIFMLANVFANLSNQSGSLWTPPFTPLFSASVTSITALLSIAILFAIPSIAGGIKESLKAKPFVDAGVGGVVGAFGAPVNIAMQGFHFWQSHSMTQAIRNQTNKASGAPPPTHP